MSLRWVVAALAGLAGGEVASVPHPETTPAVRYARLDRVACERELDRRHLAFARVPEARGVLAPVRLTGPVGGVSFHSALPAKQRARSPYEIIDCRLALALHDFAAILARHDVVEVVHYSVYRPPPGKAWPRGRVGRRHDGALALDAARFVRKDGTVLDVEQHWKAAGSPEATALRQIVRESAEAHLFHVTLTPDYNWDHRNHFHLEVTAGVKWFLVH